MIEAGANPRVVVIGGGISGLAAAHRLSTAGLSVALIEKSAELGGKVITEHIDGFVIEGGPDSFVAGKGTVIELATELGIADRIISSRPEHQDSYVWSRGRFHRLPAGLLLMAPARLGPLFGSSLLSWRGKLRAAADLLIPRGQPEGDESLESFVVRRLGREVLDRIAEPLIAGIHAAEPASMSLEASFPRFLEMERDHRSLILAARALSKRAGTTIKSHFASFRGGMGDLTAALIGSLQGADQRMGVAVNRIRMRSAIGFLLDLTDGTQLEAEAIVLATPAEDSAALLGEVAPRASEAIAGIRQVATTAVTLAYRSEQIPVVRGSGFVVPALEGRRLMGVSYLSQKWQARVPSEQFVLLRAFLRRGLSDQQPTEVAQAELADLVGIRTQPILEKTHHWASGLHQYTLGHRQRVARAEGHLRAIPGLALAGAAFHGIGLNECIASGRRAADLVAATIKGGARTVTLY
ncbi:MAG TPA: protoporphyrinogen oxidase [Acidimicrobiia bacterium]|nr:protoporphyrinogen oxidase [Acidimicrobiia bacterium]